MQLLLPLLVGKLFAIIIGIYYFRYLPRPYKWVLLTVALSAFADGYGRYIALQLHQHNSWMFNIYMIIDFGLNSIIAILLTKGSSAKRIFAALIVVYCIGWATEIMIDSIYILANFAIVLGSILLTVMYFFVLINNSIFSNKDILKQPVFWLSASTILFCAPGIPYWGLHNYLNNNALKLAAQLSYINVVLDALRHPLAAISFILLGRQKTAVLNTA